MNNALQLEDKVSRSRSKHEGEPSTGNLRQAFGRTRGSSQRQLPTDHDYAVSTREYQLDQSSPLPATAAADPVLVRKKRPAHVDRSPHINFRVAGITMTRPEQLVRSFLLSTNRCRTVNSAKRLFALSIGISARGKHSMMKVGTHPVFNLKVSVITLSIIMLTLIAVRRTAAQAEAALAPRS
ncbi:MAG: hypothetical protein WB561_05675 [Terracidiphilus sp.]